VLFVLLYHIGVVLFWGSFGGYSGRQVSDAEQMNVYLFTKS
jgi:hypothetical protein